MPWLAVAATVGGSVISGAMGSRAAGKAADAQTQAAQAQIAEQRRQYDVTRADQTPFRESGVAGNQRLSYLLGLGGQRSGAGTPEYESIYSRIMGEADAAHQARYGMPLEASPNSAGVQADREKYRRQAEEEYQAKYGSQAQGQQAGDPAYGSLLRKFASSDLQADPVYQSGLQFGLDQGTGAINSRAIAGGGYDSGATIKALTRFANDYGSTKANESYNRYNTDNTNIYNKLAGISGTGQTATNQVQAAGQNMANQVNQAQGAEGNARSAGIVGGANAWTNAINQGYGNYNNYQTNQTLQKMLNRNTPATGGYGTDYNAPGYGGSSYNQLYGAGYGAGGDPLYG